MGVCAGVCMFKNLHVCVCVCVSVCVCGWTKCFGYLCAGTEPECRKTVGMLNFIKVDDCQSEHQIELNYCEVKPHAHTLRHTRRHTRTHTQSGHTEHDDQ